MKISILDADTLGSDIDLEMIKKLGDTEIYGFTADSDVAERIKYSDVVVLNKIKLNKDNLHGAKQLKLICEAATGYDNIDVDYCRENNIAVCNVVGYSSHSVSQVTVAMAMSLVCHLKEYDTYSKSGEYTKRGIQNMLEPVYYELFGKVWGVIGYGGIGKSVGRVAEALGCKVIYTKNTPDEHSVSLSELLEQSDIISIHVPLTDKTRNMINEDTLKNCRKKPILINVSRGAVCDEEAVCRAVDSGKLSGLGMDVYSVEPFPKNSPYNKLCNCDNVILTPHMAWGAYESRIRCMNEIAENIKSYLSGGTKGRIV